MNEQEAIKRLKRGDMDALATLMQRYQVEAIRAANLITRDEAIAQDVVQSVFIRLYERSHLIDIRRSFKPYLMRSVVNAAINAANKQKRLIPFEDAIESEAAFASALERQRTGDPQQALDDSERQQRVAAALAELSPKQRAAIVMRYFLDMTESEIAAEQNEPNGTVKWRLHAARNRLRAILSWGES